MKMQITVNIQTDDGAPGAEPTQIEVEVPNFEAFTGPEAFGAVFHEYEQQVIKARNTAIEVATENYLTELAKKTVGAIVTSGQHTASVSPDRRERRPADGESDGA